ncbi:hypothetical protein MPTK1_5g10090 [Marchantia polymorpha subsp. ruderalis]|nr:hypothetical protein MARPO_0048s0063 [Marchantia polymorpha]BBN11220.1 hypothetical protein Mp_5g10090 [Marchantia polymorpha subsp. ruderalis]|eukprot:PTQ38950.1 hypothetical protein MARPO_0048s0063 [Marchantia polymorpha]
MDAGVVNRAEPTILTADDPFSTSTTTEVADYTSVPPVTEVSLSASKTDESVAAPKKSEDWTYKHNPNRGADYSMEAPILAEDVVRAGGLGARDELGHFLPSAMDATDFEASLRDAQQYEDVGPERDVPRPGVGFVKDQQNQMDGVREI